MVTASRRPRTQQLEALAELIEGVEQKPAALLVFRILDLERVAWRKGKRAALRAEASVGRAIATGAASALRNEDCVAHDNGSDVFVVGMLAPPRRSRGLTAIECRAALERIAGAALALRDLEIETGWVLVTSLVQPRSLDHEIDLALERGRRERERYEFFAAVGHELRTPLTSIRGYLETLLDDDLDCATRHHFVEIARREALRLNRLVEGMLDFSLLDLSKEHLAPASCNAREAIAAACDAIAPAARVRKTIVTQSHVADVRVGIGFDACVQAIANVLENAVKYGHPEGEIAISASPNQSYLVVHVDDDGPGIIDEERQAIFDARFRGRAARGSGRGLGLNIVKTIVERAGGELCVEASPLGGARFTIMLPMRDNLVPAS